MNTLKKMSKVLVLWGVWVFCAHAQPLAMLSTQEKVDTIIQILEQASEQNYIGEAISQQSHALQAADLAQKSGATEEVVLAALLHDIGHLLNAPNEKSMGGFGVVNHEGKAEAFLKDLGFSDKILALVKGHVEAKRYLCTLDEHYFNQLSPASKVTFKYQGGKFSPGEMKSFKDAPWFKEKLDIRGWDEKAKEVIWSGPDLEFYRPMLVRHLQNFKS